MKKTSPRPAPLPPPPTPLGCRRLANAICGAIAHPMLRKGCWPGSAQKERSSTNSLRLCAKCGTYLQWQFPRCHLGTCAEVFPGGRPTPPYEKEVRPSLPPTSSPGGGRASGGGRGRTSFSHEGVVAPPDSLLKWGTLSPPASPSRPPARGVGGRGVLFLFFAEGGPEDRQAFPGKHLRTFPGEMCLLLVPL